MSAEQAQREPTMEEILASIRRIISEEDQPAAAGGEVLDLQPPTPPPVEAKAPPKPEAAPAPARTPPSRVFDEPDDPLPSRPLEDDLMIVEREVEFEPAPEPAPAPRPQPAAPQAEWRPMQQETLTSEPVAHHAAGSLSRLVTLPSSPTLVGVSFAQQTVVLESAAGVATLVTTSNAAELSVGSF